MEAEEAEVEAEVEGMDLGAKLTKKSGM